MVSVPLLAERMGVEYFEENLLELYLQVCTGTRSCVFLVHGEDVEDCMYFQSAGEWSSGTFSAQRTQVNTEDVYGFCISPSAPKRT